MHRTPVLTSRLFDQAVGKQCFFKCENLQRGGAFKIRGAMNFLYSIPEQDRHRGVVAFSSGNHAQAVAMAAASLGIKATIAMPTDAPANKLAATRSYGAEVVSYDRFKDDREAVARSLADRTGATLVPPFDHEWIIAGQGTAALELLQEVPSLDALLVCVGGGGLLAGSCLAAKGVAPAIRIFGAEPENANDTYLSFRAGERIEIPPPDTIADGLRPTKPGALTFPVVQQHVEDILLASEEQIGSAVQFVQSRMKIIVEPSGAVPAAVALAGKLPAGVRQVGIIVSGGNV
ncbi:MAG TPA: pyridoxal-phosphate dependent enzyme [Bryobacteraceae bacterium]|nr:pyridoxal-phosphate dependent enzyme [Bryobacteraceae bacterium]